MQNKSPGEIYAYLNAKSLSTFGRHRMPIAHTWAPVNKPMNILTLIFIAFLSSCNDEKPPLRLNHVQVIGSHNSYKKAIQPALLEVAIAQNDDIKSLAYSHLSLREQLDLGLRKLEIDIFHDPDGGRYSKPLGNLRLGQAGIPVDSFDQDGDLLTPGFKVFHVQDIDFRSHCLLLADCLIQIKTWSEAHTGHLPIVITINVKTGKVDDPDAVEPLAFTPEVYEALDEAFRQGLGSNSLITPEMVKTKAPSLNTSILTKGWPTLDDCREKFLIVLDEPMSKINTYLGDNYPGEKVMFANTPEGHPASAFIILNNPLVAETKIAELVTAGYIVRTRADANTIEAVNGDYSKFEAAKRSGAQYISTDYYYRTLEHPDFLIQFENGSYVRCNPILQNPGCLITPTN